MAQVNVQQAHTLGRDAAVKRLAQLEEMLAKYRAKLEWTGSKAKIKGIGVGGDVTVTDTAVQVQVELGMAARLAGVDAQKLQGSIERRLREALA